MASLIAAGVQQMATASQTSRWAVRSAIWIFGSLTWAGAGNIPISCATPRSFSNGRRFRQLRPTTSRLPMAWLSRPSFDDAASETDVAVVQDDRLARRDRPLCGLERDLAAPAISIQQSARGIRLTIARLGGIAPWRGRAVSGYPARLGRAQAVAVQNRMIVSLRDQQSVRLQILARDVPGFTGSA